LVYCSFSGPQYVACRRRFHILRQTGVVPAGSGRKNLKSIAEIIDTVERALAVVLDEIHPAAAIPYGQDRVGPSIQAPPNPAAAAVLADHTVVVEGYDPTAHPSPATPADLVRSAVAGNRVSRHHLHQKPHRARELGELLARFLRELLAEL